MIINRTIKHHQDLANESAPKEPNKPTSDENELNHQSRKSIAKFNFGGLFKKKANAKRTSIDSITESSSSVQYVPNSASSYTLNSYSLPDNDNASSVHFNYPTYTVPDEERYTSFTTECISLQNSEMTSHQESDCDEAEGGLPHTSHHHTIMGELTNDEINHEQELNLLVDPNMEESLNDYKKGGYHPVIIGDIYKSPKYTYQILRKLGWGHFSTVWLAKIISKPSQNGSNLVNVNDLVAIKIVKSNKNYFEAADDEIKILKILNDDNLDFDFTIENDEVFNLGKNNILKLHDDFLITGPNGKHICMVFELLGENVLHLIYKYKKDKIEMQYSGVNSKHLTYNPSIIPLNSIKVIVKQILHSINYMHHRGIIHTDLKPENILVKYSNNFDKNYAFNQLPNNNRYSKQIIFNLRPLPSSLLDNSITVKIADLGNATFSNLHFTDQIQTRQYRAPEIILRYKNWGASADLWSIGCIIFELITGDYLFDPHDGVNFDKDEDHLAQIIELLGEFPNEEYLLNCKLTNKFFVKDGESFSLKNISRLKFWKLEDVLIEKYKFDANDINVKLISDLILKCLRFNLDDRYDCKSLLSHPWFDENPVYDPVQLNNLPNIHDDIPGYTATWETE